MVETVICDEQIVSIGRTILSARVSPSILANRRFDVILKTGVMRWNAVMVLCLTRDMYGDLCSTGL